MNLGGSNNRFEFSITYIIIIYEDFLNKRDSSTLLSHWLKTHAVLNFLEKNPKNIFVFAVMAFPWHWWQLKCCLERKNKGPFIVQSVLEPLMIWCCFSSPWVMMTLSEGNIFRYTDPSWWESTDHRWIPLTKAGDAELWCFLWTAPGQTVVQTLDTPAIWDAIELIMTSLQWMVCISAGSSYCS